MSFIEAIVKGNELEVKDILKNKKKESVFEIQRLYVKEQSCKLPHGSSVFLEEWKPDVHLEMNVRHEKLRESVYEVVLQIHATARNNQRTAFVVEVQQAGIFKIEGLDEKQLQYLLEARCPNILYSYARKVIADKTLEASFPAFLLTPVDFEVLYAQRQMPGGNTNKNSVTQQEEIAVTH